MNLCKVIVFLPLIIGAVSGYCNINSELEHVEEQIAECENGISPYYVIGLLEQMSTDTLRTFEQFVAKLMPFCEKTTNTLNCLGQNVNVREDCQENGQIQSVLNIQITSWYIANYLCDNNATQYKDLAVADGPTCYANNDLHRQCIFQPKYERIVFDRAAVSNRNICSILGITVDCLSAYDNCENQNVRSHIEKLNQQLQYRYGCLNY